MKPNWKPTTEADYDDMLGMLPPAAQTGKGFLVGEPMSHRACTITGQTKPTFTAFACIGRSYFKADQPMTIAEFNTGSREGFGISIRDHNTGEQTDA